MIISQRRNVASGTHCQYAGQVSHESKYDRQAIAQHQHPKGQLRHLAVLPCYCSIVYTCTRQRHIGWRLIGTNGVYACEDDDCASDGDKHEEEEKAVGHTEESKWEVIVISDPVIAAADEAQGYGEDTHQ